jgi:hypothetical protein
MAFTSIFTDKCDSTSAFESVLAQGTGQTTTVISNGYLGSGIQLVLNNTEFNEVGLRKEFVATTARRLQFWLRINNEVAGDARILHVWSSDGASAYGNGDFLQLDAVPGASSTQYKLKLNDLVNTASNTGSTELNTNTWYRISLAVTNANIRVYINNLQTAECTITDTFTGENFGATHFGKFYTTGVNGNMVFDNIAFYAEQGSAPTATLDKIEDTYQGKMERFLCFEGGIVRPDVDGSGGDSDIVSEGVAYGLNDAVQYDDQATFDLIEEFCYTVMERRNHPSDSTIQTNGPHLMGFLYRNKTNTFADWNYAPDADNDRVIALLWAHARWGSAGTINYLQRAEDIGADLIVASEEWSSKKYQVSNYFELGDATIEMNPSYLHPIAFRMLKQYTNNTDYDKLVEGSYDYLEKASDNTGALANANGLIPNWGGFVVATGADALSPNMGRTTDYAYESFRALWRLRLDELFYNEPRATTLLSNIHTFFDSEWNGGAGQIWAEYELDGTPNMYENTLFYAINVLAFDSAGDTTDRDDIIDTKIENTYTHHPAGSFWSDNPNTPSSGAASYYADSWIIFGMMTLFGVFENYGQETPSSGGNFFMLMGVG